jgi:Leucine-rich repeat (LRR) protein
MEGVDLGGILDWAHVVNRIPSLKVLRFSSCFLSSANQSLPYLNLTDLEELSISGNYFDNPIASCWFWNLTSLRHLELAVTPLYGQVPEALRSMTSLEVLDFSDSDGSIDIMTADMRNLCNLERLDLSSSSFNRNGGEIMGLLPQCPHNKLKELHLEDSSFTGVLPDWIGHRWSSLVILDLHTNQFTGPVPSEISMLSNLLTLDLSKNNFSGNVPSGIGMLSNLFTLDLSNNKFTGHVPTEIGMLNNLWNLVLSNNQFTGPILSSIGMINNLGILDLCNNKFTGPMPSEIGFLKNLWELIISNNQFTGPVPSEIGMLNNLLALDLSNNEFTGTVPSELGMLNKLSEIYLMNNNLSGFMTQEHFGNLASLTTIDLSGNSLKIMVDQEWLPPFKLEHANFASCQMGPLFPTWLQLQTGIVELNISRASIFGNLPNWFVTTFQKVSIMDISNNGISGTLPENLQNMASLELLLLNSNNLSGPIPQLPIVLRGLDCSYNSLSGYLPSNFGSQNLEFLNLASNHLSGPIQQSICHLSYLDQVNLANNHFDGVLPLCFESGGPRVLILRNNRLSGKFPSSLKVWKNLCILDLAWNKFTGRIPIWIGDFTELIILQLNDNMFSGSIPSTITRLKGLTQLNLAGNSISGPLPLNLSNLRGMTKEHIWDLPGSFPVNLTTPRTQRTVNLSVITKGQERYYKDDNLYNMVSIDLSSNRLSGILPEELASLDGLVNLNLSRNQLSGKIPNSIGGMQSLESLDLSENKISGEIPQSLSTITYLGYLDLSYNNLTGRIPSGGQLDTLYAQYPLMYNGNRGLCGHPLVQNCSSSSEPKHGDHERNVHDSKVLSFSIGLSVGYVVGLWVVFCVILFKHPWRVAYFCLIDKAFDNVYVFVFVTWARWAKGSSKHDASW